MFWAGARGTRPNVDLVLFFQTHRLSALVGVLQNNDLSRAATDQCSQSVCNQQIL